MNNSEDLLLLRLEKKVNDKHDVEVVLKRLKNDDLRILYFTCLNKNNDIYMVSYFQELMEKVSKENINDVTCRRRLKFLEGLGLIKTVRGSAMMIQPIQEYSPLIEAEMQNRINRIMGINPNITIIQKPIDVRSDDNE